MREEQKVARSRLSLGRHGKAAAARFAVVNIAAIVGAMATVVLALIVTRLVTTVIVSGDGSIFLLFAGVGAIPLGVSIGIYHASWRFRVWQGEPRSRARAIALSAAALAVAGFILTAYLLPTLFAAAAWYWVPYAVAVLVP